MAASKYSTSISATQQALLVLEEQMNSMRSAANTVEGITQAVDTHYIAQSSSTFTRKMNDWIDAYNQVMQKVNTLHDSLQRAVQVQDRGEQDAVEHAVGWTGDLSAVDHVTGVLSGN